MRTRTKYKVEDYLGQRFNNWTVLGFVRLSSAGDSWWRCRCVCGNEQEVFRRNLFNGTSRQCKTCMYTNRPKVNLIPIEPYLGTKINCWTVLGFSHHSNNKKGQFWNVRCECGLEKALSASAIVSGRSKQCVECRRDAKSEHNRRLPFPANLYHRAQKGAEKRNIPWAITHEEASDIWEQHQSKCALSGVTIVCGRTAKHESTASMDRIDSSRGYTKDNVQFVHKTVNKLKSNFPETEFVQWCKLITEHTSTI